MGKIEMLVEHKTEIDSLREDIGEVKDSSDKVRKSLFARNADLAKKYLDLSDRMAILERNICQGSYRGISQDK